MQSNQPQGYGPQPLQSQQQLLPEPLQQEQTVKFYKSSLFLIASAAGRLQRDLPYMEQQGWRLVFAAPLGVNILLRRVVITIWIRSHSAS